MSITTYSELETAVADWLARSDLTSAIPDFITFAEAKFNRSLRTRQMEQRSTASVDTSYSEPEFISLPSDFQSMRRIRLPGVTGKPRINFQSGTAMDEYRTAIANGTGQPVYFTIVGSEIELCPTPDQNYSIEMTYRKYIPALSDSNTTNWLLTLAPDLYVYGTLLEASPYIQNDERIPIWSAAVETITTALNKLSDDSTYNAGPMNIRNTALTP